MKKLSYTLMIDPDHSTHYVSVHVHSSRAVMRGVLTRVGHKSSNTQAACWQPSKVTDGCVAEVHFGRDHLSLDTIAHEMSHAAFHRTVLIGIPLTHTEFQEWVAETTGRLVGTFLAALVMDGVRVSYSRKISRIIT